VKRVLITGMSGTGKSSVLHRLGELGYRTIDTDEDDFTMTVATDDGVERLWREERIQAVLSATDAELTFVSGTCRNQVHFYAQFHHIVLLSAPPSVLVERMASRKNNPYGKRPEEIAETLQYVQTVEPLLRRSATLEVDTTAPLEEVVRKIVQHVLE
jgi:shikimate kinase